MTSEDRGPADEVRRRYTALVATYRTFETLIAQAQRLTRESYEKYEAMPQWGPGRTAAIISHLQSTGMSTFERATELERLLRGEPAPAAPNASGPTDGAGGQSGDRR